METERMRIKDKELLNRIKALNSDQRFVVEVSVNALYSAAMHAKAKAEAEATEDE
jgi:hypothetical protein